MDILSACWQQWDKLAQRSMPYRHEYF